MLGTLGFLTITVFMGGIIAYEGDLIGRRFGKRRVTLFGLRPRYTAVLITSVTGVAISFMTTLVLFAAVPSVRNLILRGERAIRDIRILEEQQKQSRAKLNEQVAVIAANKVELDETRAEVVKVNKQAEESRIELAARQKKLELVGGQLKAAESRLAAAESKLNETRAQNSRLAADNKMLAGKNSTLVDINTALATSNEKLTRTNQDLTKQNDELARDNVQKKALNADLAKENEALASRNEDLTRQNTELEKQHTVLTRMLDEQRGENDRLHADNLRLIAHNKQLTETNSELQEVVKQIAPGYSSLRDAYWASRSRRVAVHKDEDLARIVIPAGTDPTGVRGYIADLLRNASEAAKSHGAAPGDGLLAVQVVNREFYAAGPDGQVETYQVTGDDRIDAVVSKVAWQTNPCALLAIAVANSVEQEPAAIDLQPFTNKRVFAKGQVVQGRYFNATQPTPGIVNDVVKFLKDMGRYALDQGVIPNMDPLTGEPQIGAMDFGEVVELADRIKGYGGRVRVRALAQQDTFSADPLKVHFEVTP